MKSKLKFILREELAEFIKEAGKDNNIFRPPEPPGRAESGENGAPARILDSTRAAIPLKAFFVNHGETLARHGGPRPQPGIIFGAKACDLKAKKILDEIYLGGVCRDPAYEFHDGNTIVFSSDCPRPSGTCFCNLVGGKPYVESGDYPYDLNFSPVKDGFLVDVGTEKGGKIVEACARFFRDADPRETEERERMRKDAVAALENANSAYAGLKNLKLESLLAEKFESPAWKDSSQTCVQCGGCNNACPSCYCFYLDENDGDRISGELSPKTRLWDACHYTSYGRVAGGANSRPKLYERFRNRYECKYNYRKENFGVYACTGCGRCVSVCPGKIDMRQVLAKVAGII